MHKAKWRQSNLQNCKKNLRFSTDTLQHVENDSDTVQILKVKNADRNS